MSPSVEDSLWKSAGVRSVAELPDFPFPSHKDFVAAVRNGDASVGIEYRPARDLAHVTKSRAAQYALFSLGGIPILFIPASIVVAMVTGRWATLVGIPAALSGMALASPYNPLRHVVLLGSLASVTYCLIAATVFTAGTWSAFAFGLSFFAVRFLNRTAWNWAHKAILGSEALTAYLWKTRNLHIKCKTVGTKSAALTRASPIHVNRDIANRAMGPSGHATDPYLSRYRTNRAAAVLLYVLVPLGVGLWQAWSDPIGANRILLIGGFLALIGTVSYRIAMELEGRSWIRGRLILAGFLPYAFAVYLTFYKGLWGFSELLAGFSWHVVVRAGAWTFVGGRLAQSLMELTDLGFSPASQLTQSVSATRTDAMVLPPDEEVIGSFGEFLQASSARHTALGKTALETSAGGPIDWAVMWELRPHLRPESELPYPVATIRAAIERALVRTDDPKLYEHLRVGLVCLRDYAPDAEVPTDQDENLREWERRSREPLPPPFEARTRE